MFSVYTHAIWGGRAWLHERLRLSTASRKINHFLQFFLDKKVPLNRGKRQNPLRKISVETVLHKHALRLLFLMGNVTRTHNHILWQWAHSNHATVQDLHKFWGRTSEYEGLQFLKPAVSRYGHINYTIFTCSLSNGTICKLVYCFCASSISYSVKRKISLFFGSSEKVLKSMLILHTQNLIISFSGGLDPVLLSFVCSPLLWGLLFPVYPSHTV